MAEERNFHQYDGQDWVEDLPAIEPRHSITLVYLDGSIYAIGGEEDDQETPLTSVECFNIAKQEWEDKAPMPEEFGRGFRISSAITYHGKILVYVVSREGDRFRYSNSGKQVVLVYDPFADVWQTTLTEDHEGYGDTPDPILFLHNDVCYKVSSMVPKQSTLYDENKDVQCRPTVNVLEIGEDVATVSVGEDVNQDLIPLNKVGAFRVQNEVFVNVKGFVYKTDIKIRNGQKGNVNLSKWKNMGELKNRQSNIVNFTFDLKELAYQYDD